MNIPALRRPWRLAPMALLFTAATALALLLTCWAWHLKHPVMMWLRPLETPLLLLSAGLGAGLMWRQRRHTGWRKWAALLPGLLFATALAVTLCAELWFQWQRHRVHQASPLLRQLGGHFLIGFRDYASLAPLAEHGLIGGIYLTRRNIAGRSLSEVQEEIARLQTLRKKRGLPPLFVAADQEGGTVNHLSPLLPARPALASLSKLDSRQREKAAYRYGQQHGDDLAALGVNLNLSPVVDLKPRKKSWWLDTHTLVDRRAISGDAEVVGQIAAAYSSGLQTRGVQATLKHFPGLGRVRADTHHRPARLALPLEKLAQEWQPFEQISRQTGSAIMVAHVHLDAIDPERPASQSRKVIDGTLRRQWQHQGLILTDDLNMGAVYRQGIGPAATASLAAGADLVLITYDHDQFYRALYDTAQAYRRGAIDDRLLLASRERIRQHRAQAEKKRATVLVRNAATAKG